ncbi:hypothetical protein FB107DRAFT_293380 [Schizophyllum commune]
MRFIFLLVLISAVAAAPVKRDSLPFEPASAPTATASKYPTPPGAVPAVGGGVRGVEGALPAVGNTVPAVAGSLDKGIVGSLVGPQRRALAGGDAVVKRAASDVPGEESTTPSSGAIIKPMTIPFFGPTDAFVRPTITYYPFKTAGVDWKRQYGAGNGGEYGAGAAYGGRAGYDAPYPDVGRDADGHGASYNGDAYSGDAIGGYSQDLHAGYGAGANADGYTYVKTSGSISGSYEAMMAGGGAMDGYGRAGMDAGSHGEESMSGRFRSHGTSPASPAYDASSPAIPAEPTAAPPAVHVPIPYATAGSDASAPALHKPGPMIGAEEPSYLADHGRNAYNIPEGPATDVSLQPYTPTDAPQDTAYPEPTYTANVASVAPVDNSPATYDYPAAAKPTEWSYPTADVTDSLLIYSTPTADGYPSEEKPSEWVYPSVNEGSDYGATDAPTPTFDPTLYTTAPAPHGLGMEPWGPGPAEEVKPTMEVEPTYAVQAAPTEAASVIYK